MQPVYHVCVVPAEFDLFVSHASEDKARFVDALVAALRERGLSIWYDSNEIRLGDDFRRQMDEGLSRSRFGVMVLSPDYFKYLPQAELSALFIQEATFDQTRILPIRLDMDRATLTMKSPLLAARAELGWELGVHVLAERIHDRIREMRTDTRSARSPVYNFPARRARQLFGREADLVRLELLLVPGRNVSIEGLAGVGKTELALHIVDRLSETDRFPGGIFWLDAENPDLTVVWGSTIADALAVGPGTVEERAAGAVRIASSGLPVLVVLDNVEKWTRESEPKPLPYGSRVALLATTRHRFLAGPAFDHHSLDTLPGDTAREFLSFIAGRDLDANDLLYHLDGHALAIELAGAYLREFPNETPAAYLKKLTEGAPAEEKVQNLVRYEATVQRALGVHWEHLDDTGREALLVAACFAPEDASIELLEACGVDADAQQPLRRFHLISGSGERWRMHPLVREWARRTASTEDLRGATRRFVEGCAEFSGQIDFEEGFRIYRADGAHLEEAAREAEAALGFDDERVSLLLNGLGTGLCSMGDLPRARDVFERALALDLKNFGGDDPMVATSRSNLAGVLERLGDLPRAKELLELTLASALKNLGEDHPNVAIRRSNLAGVLKALGDLPRAKELLELTLASALKNLGEDHPNVAIHRSNLAGVLKALGDLPRAKELLELTLASALKNLGEDHPTVAQARFDLGAVFRDLGDFAHARELFGQALTADERSLGADHPVTSLVRVSLAEVLHMLGENELARAEAERALHAVASQPGELSFRKQVERIGKRVGVRVLTERIHDSDITFTPLSTQFPIPSPPPALLRAFANDEVVLYAGAGLSRECGFPLWPAFVRQILDLAVTHKLLDDDFAESLHAALDDRKIDLVADSVVSILRERQPSVLRDYLLSNFGRSDVPLSPIHEELRRLNFRAAMTTNFDNLLQVTFKDRAPRLYTPRDTDALLNSISRREFFILKLYGDVRDDDVLVAPAQYEEVIRGNRAFASVIETLFFSSTILFIGASLEGIETYLRGISFPGSQPRPHYALVPVSGAAWRTSADVLRRRYGIHVLPIDDHGHIGGRVLTFVRQFAASARTTTPPSIPSHGIRTVTLENIGPFRKLTLELNPRWNVLLGDNGVGKSSVLRAIAAAFVGRETPSPERLLTSGEVRGQITLEIGRPYRLEIHRKGVRGAEAVSHIAPIETEGVLTLGFPAMRTVSWNRPNSPQSEELVRRPAASDLVPLIIGGLDPRLDDLKQWLVSVDYQAKRGSDAGYETVLHTFFETIAELTEGMKIEFLGVHPQTYEVQIATDDGPIPLEALSQGTISLLGWIGILLQRLSEALPADDVPLRERPAIVLIDEIDAHLHPAWQQTLVSRLSRLFPNVQFIATTHSPLMVGGLEASQVFRFAREDGEVVMLDVEDEMTVGRTDQILTSDLFGLRTTLDTETSEAAARYRVLLGKPSRDAIEEKEFRELEDFLAFRIPASPETPVERHAQHLLELLLRRIVGGQFAPAKEEVLGAAEKLFATVAKGQKATQESKA